MKFRKKPVVIDAIQFTGNNNSAIMVWADRHGVDLSQWMFVDGQVMIPTLEGVMTAKPNDWIIRGVKGEFYPVKPDIFAVTYEKEEEV